MTSQATQYSINIYSGFLDIPRFTSSFFLFLAWYLASLDLFFTRTFLDATLWLTVYWQLVLLVTSFGHIICILLAWILILEHTSRRQRLSSLFLHLSRSSLTSRHSSLALVSKALHLYGHSYSSSLPSSSAASQDSYYHHHLWTSFFMTLTSLLDTFTLYYRWHLSSDFSRHNTTSHASTHLRLHTNLTHSSIYGHSS